jgi:hypothetical protein
MAHRARLVSVFVALLALASALTLELEAQSSHAAFSTTLNAYVDQNGFIGINYADGTPIGNTIPPGTYTVNVDDSTDIHQFHLFGPGFDRETDIDQVTKETWTVTFQAGDLYTFECDLHADIMFGQFRAAGTAATAGSGSSGSTSSSSSSAGSSSGGTSSGKPQSNNQDVVGSKTDPFRGTLEGVIGSTGKLTLALNGKSVSTLKFGRYAVSVDDKTAKGGFVLQQVRKLPVTVTGTAFTGKRTVTVDLTAGQWMYYSPAGKKSTGYFIVHG